MPDDRSRGACGPLPTQQAGLLGALWAPSLEAADTLLVPLCQGLRPGTAWRQAGLQAYRGHAAATAERALAAVCPTVQALLGEADFAALARALWQRDPPRQGDLGEWGGALPELIAGTPGLQPWPFLADMARLDAACHAAERAVDQGFDADSLALLARADPAQLTLVLAPGTALIDSPHPLAALWQAHHDPDAVAREAAWARARDALGAPVAAPESMRWTCVWRSGWRGQCAEVDATEAAWLRRLLHGDSLADALQAAPALDFADWLARALGQGLCLGVRLSCLTGDER